MNATTQPRSTEPTRRRGAGMRAVKRWLAAAGAIIAVTIAASALGFVNLTVQEGARNANPATAFSATEVVPNALAGRVHWNHDDQPLARRVEPTTREQLTATWIRAHDALERAATGDRSGLDVWFVGPALEQATARFTGTDPDRRISARHAVAHDLMIRFYSLDGQVAVVTSTTTYERTNPSAGATAAATEEVDAILVLADGNWRIRNLTRAAR